MTVTFAATTDERAWVDGDGHTSPHFGGTGIRERELAEYIDQSVEIWKAITGKETGCTLPEGVA